VQQQVIDWRHHVLVDAGYTDEIAQSIAESDADLHRAVELLRLGCEPEVAARILV
jgi:predicted metal-binding transcription factor (methanogenesis marker protein 9)